MSRWIAWRLLLVLCAGCSVAEESPSVEPSGLEWTAMGLAGEARRLLPDEDHKAIVLLFVLHDCPIANAYAAEINRLHADYRPRGALVYLVHCDPEIPLEQAREHAREYDVHCQVVIDLEHRLARLSGATKTPEAAVVSPQGQVLYLGRIDDLYAGYGQRRAAATSRDLCAALDAVLAGQKVSNPRTEVVGCTIPLRSHEDAKP
jgi:hypothetical protein